VPVTDITVSFFFWKKASMIFVVFSLARMVCAALTGLCWLLLSVCAVPFRELGRDKQSQDSQLVVFRALAQNYRINENAHAGKLGPLGTTE
jgi:hypothetical protein